jgi:DNA-binding transcriptional LysR family regulator
MNERQLRYACGVWRERSFSRAAERLRVSQPSLSDQVRLLEEEVGFPIFYRGARGIEPSVNGQNFLERAEQVLETLARLEHLGRQLRGVEQKKFRVGFNTGIAARFLPGVTQVASEQATKFRLEVATSTNRRIQRLIFQEKLDAGFLLNADLENWSKKLRVVAEIESDIVFVVPPGHALAGLAPDLLQIAACPLIVSETELGSGRAVVKLFKDAGVEPHIVADCDNVQSVKDMVMSGLGVALMPRICVEQEAKSGALCVMKLEHAPMVFVQLVCGIRNSTPLMEKCITDLAEKVLCTNAAGDGA